MPFGRGGNRRGFKPPYSIGLRVPRPPLLRPKLPRPPNLSLYDKHSNGYYQDKLKGQHWLEKERKHQEREEMLRQSGFVDINLVCENCGEMFTFKAGEQEFFQSKGFSNPKQCLSCRAAKKQAKTGTKEEWTHHTEFVDSELICRDCNLPFTFSAGEKEFFHRKGFSNPTRCRSCRTAHKKNR